MIKPPLMRGAAFTDSSDGDIRGDLDARASLSGALALSAEWATVRQVHGKGVLKATGPGVLGDADALWTSRVGLPVAVFTADCYGVILEAENAVGIAHAGWRGARLEVVAALLGEMESNGHAVTRAAIGPGIGRCCFEVGSVVAREFPLDQSTTAWNTASVDLVGSISRQLPGIELWSADLCTHHDAGFFSHRMDGTAQRLAAVGWLP